MKKFKKAALTAASYVSVAALAIGGTVAYMTASVNEDNLMVAGKGVEIELLEQQRTGVDGELVDFEDGKVLMPISDGQGEKDKWGMPVIDGYVDKIVRVSNTGENDAYVRVFVAIPSKLEGTAANENILHWNYGNRFDATGASTYNAMNVNDTVSLYNAEVKQADVAENFTIDGIEYNIYSFTYLDALKAGDTTDYATLVGCYLDDDVDYQNGEYVINGEKLAYDLSQGIVIPVFAQGIQTTSFDSAEAAFAASKLPSNPWANEDGSASTTSVSRVKSADELTSAIENGATKLILSKGTYTLPKTVAGKDITIVGTGEDTVIDCTAAQALNDADVSFTNVKIQGVDKNYIGYQHTSSVIYTDCIIDSRITLYADDVVFNNCVFNGTGDYIWTYGADNVTFNNCEFNNKNSKAILVYQESDSEVCNVTLTNCHFTAQEKAYTSSGDHTAAVEIDSSLAPANVVIENCTADENYNGIVRHKKGSNATITVDGVAQ